MSLVPTYTPRNPTLPEYWQLNFDAICEGYLSPEEYSSIDDVPEELEALISEQARLDPMFMLQTITYGLEVPSYEQTFKESLWLLSIILFDSSPDESNSSFQKISMAAAPYWAYEASCNLIYGFKTGDLGVRKIVNNSLNTESFLESFWEIYHPIFVSRLVQLREHYLEEREYYPEQ